MKLSGGCLCGGVRYQFDGDPVMVFHCHCRDCQRHGGSLVHYGILVRESSLELDGELASYEKVADSGKKVTRQFCPTCGSGVCNRIEIAPGMVAIKGGTVDEADSRPKPTFALYTDSQPEWISCEDLRGFEREPNVPPPELRWKP
jgi:hypothetical protein